MKLCGLIGIILSSFITGNVIAGVGSTASCETITWDTALSFIVLVWFLFIIGILAGLEASK
jgi:hypothetical protein